MDRQDLFDTLTIRFTDVAARRDVLRILGKFVLAMIVFGAYPWRVRAQDVSPESALVKGCRLQGQKCSGDADCCTKRCDSSHRCGCLNKGKEALADTPLGPVPLKALCCTNKINKRTNKCR
jgi:hypothetical protein